MFAAFRASAAATAASIRTRASSSGSMAITLEQFGLNAPRFGSPCLIELLDGLAVRRFADEDHAGFDCVHDLTQLFIGWQALKRLAPLTRNFSMIWEL